MLNLLSVCYVGANAVRMSVNWQPTVLRVQLAKLYVGELNGGNSGLTPA